MSRHNREITIKKSDLIAKVKENQINHIKDYEQAVIDYKKEAQLQLETQLKELAAGKMNIRIHLVVPIDNRLSYDDIVKMFEWELKDEVMLTQAEFNEYILDKTSASEIAFLNNSTYRGKF